MAVVTPEEPSKSDGCSLWVIGIALILVSIALYIGVNIIGVLYGIVMPPLPPLPNNVTETRHESAEYGVDDWTYMSVDDPCALADFYSMNGGVCQFALNQCGREGSQQVEWPAIAQCSGEQAFSIFHMRWNATISPETDISRLELRREVFWIGTGPSTTPSFDVGQLSSSPNATTAP